MNLKNIFLIIFIFLSGVSFAQKEKGKVVTAPKIPQTAKKTPPLNTKVDEFDFIFEDETRLRFKSSFQGKNTNEKLAEITEGIRIEPLRELDRVIHEDTSSLDESELMIVEIEEEAQFAGSSQMVKVASYYTIWDTRSLNPYGKPARNFNENINISLYNEAEGRNWAPMLDGFRRLSSRFGWRNRRWHLGTDLALVTGDKVHSAFDGIVRISGTYSGYGNTVMVRHYNGLETLYGHLSKVAFEPNTLVKAGDVIGLGGSTGRSSGPHLHFETRYEGNQFNSENIYDYSDNQVNIKYQDFTLSSKLYDYLRGKGTLVDTKYLSVDENDDFIEDADDLSGDEEYVEEIPVATRQNMLYTVKKGDTLIGIAKKSNMTLNELLQLNKISRNKKIYPGLKLRIR